MQNALRVLTGDPPMFVRTRRRGQSSVFKLVRHPDKFTARRDDVRHERLEDGFRLTSRYRSQTVRGGPHHARLGDLIREGTHTTADITDALIQAGMPVLDAAAWLDRVYHTGVIAER